MRFLFFLFCFLPLAWLGAQDSRYVVAEGGLNMRTKPEKNAPKVLRIPNGAEVKMTTQAYKSETIDGRKGQWRKVTYNGKTGFVFDAYLAENKPTKDSKAKEEKPKQGAKTAEKGSGLTPTPARPQTPRTSTSLHEAKAAAFLIYDDGNYSDFDLINDADVLLWNTVLGEGMAKRPSIKTLLRVQASTSLRGQQVQIVVEDLASKKTLHNKKHEATAQPIDVVLTGTGCGRLSIKVLYQTEALMSHQIDFRCGE